MPKTIETIVSTKLKDLRVPISQNSTGRELFYRIVAHIGLKEIWYFGLQYTDSRNNNGWLKLNRKVVHHDIKRDGTVIRLKFRVKFYPEDLSDELIQMVTQKLFFMQARDAIVNDEIYCPTDKTVLLASLSCQAEFGEFSSLPKAKGFLTKEKLLPDRVIDQYNFSKEEWDKRISELWKRHGNMHSDDAMLGYLKIVQDLEMYGISFFEIENKKGSNLWLGIDCFGLHIYEKENKLTPKVGFPWNEIKTLSFTDRRFIIKPIEKKSPDFVFTVAIVTTNKRILALSMGNHELYMRRRRPEPVEIVQLKAEANTERMKKRGERMTLQREREGRVKAQQMNKQLEEKAKNYEMTARETEQALQEARQNNMELERRRIMLEREKRKISTELSKRDDENEYLRNKFTAINDEMQKALEERKAKDLKNDAIKAEKLQKEREEQKKKEEMESHTDDIPESLQAIFYNGSPKSSPTQGRFRVPEPDEVDGGSSAHQDLSVMMDAKLPEYDRKGSMDTYIQSYLDVLGRDIYPELRETELTELDYIYAANIQAGRNKYNTMRRIRMGNTKQRVDQFECM